MYICILSDIYIYNQLDYFVSALMFSFVTLIEYFYRILLG